MGYDFNPSTLLNDPPQRVSGYCIFVDIVGSTALKAAPITQWAGWFHNTFINAVSELGWNHGPLKIIGDCAMFFIEHGKVNALQLYERLYKLAAEPDDRVYRSVKIAACSCSEAFYLTFERDRKDVYGQDIDLTHRLLGLAEEREIVMNERFVLDVKEAHSKIGDKAAHPEVDCIFGPWPQRIKGFDKPVPIFKTVVPSLPEGRWVSQK